MFELVRLLSYFAFDMMKKIKLLMLFLVVKKSLNLFVPATVQHIVVFESSQQLVGNLFKAEFSQAYHFYCILDLHIM